MYAEWFTIAGDQVYYKSEIKKDLFGNTSGGDRLMVKSLEPAQGERDLAPESERRRFTGGGLMGFGDGGMRRYDGSGDGPQTLGAINEAVLEVWPYAHQVFEGDRAVYWAVETAPREVAIVSLSSDGSVSYSFSVQLDAGEVDLVIDEADGLLMIGSISSAPPRGLAVTQIFMVDPVRQAIQEIETNPSARADAGGGLHMLRLP